MAETRFHSALKAKVLAVIEDRKNSVAEGACHDYPNYMYNVGHLEAFRVVLGLCTEVEKEFE
jgi:hypothetical protein